MSDHAESDGTIEATFRQQRYQAAVRALLALSMAERIRALAESEAKDRIVSKLKFMWADGTTFGGEGGAS